MSVLEDGTAYRKAVLGNGLASKTGVALSAATLPAFTVAGGEVYITGLWVKVTSSITTDGGTLAVNNVPTAGNTMTLVVATDLGTTDSVTGTVIGLDAAATAAPSFLRGGRIDLKAIVTTGVINLVGAAAINGTVSAYVTWVPLTVGATLVAA